MKKSLRRCLFILGLFVFSGCGITDDSVEQPVDDEVGYSEFVDSEESTEEVNNQADEEEVDKEVDKEVDEEVELDEEEVNKEINEATDPDDDFVADEDAWDEVLHILDESGLLADDLNISEVAIGESFYFRGFRIELGETLGFTESLGFIGETTMPGIEVFYIPIIVTNISAETRALWSWQDYVSLHFGPNGEWLWYEVYRLFERDGGIAGLGNLTPEESAESRIHVEDVGDGTYVLLFLTVDDQDELVTDVTKLEIVVDR